MVVGPHTAWKISSRVTASPDRSARAVRTSNSVLVSSTASSPRWTSRAWGFTVTSPKRHTGAGRGPARRSTARIRARSSARLKGLVT